MPNRRVWTDERLDRLAALFLEGATVDLAAAKLKTTPDSIMHACKKYRLSARRLRWEGKRRRAGAKVAPAPEPPPKPGKRTWKLDGPIALDRAVKRKKARIWRAPVVAKNTTT